MTNILAYAIMLSMSRESFPTAATPEGQPPQPGIDPALVANRFAPEVPPVPGAEAISVATAFPTAETISGAVSEGIVKGLRDHAESERARQEAALAKAQAAEAREAEARAAQAKLDEAARLARISAMPDLPLVHGPPAPRHFTTTDTVKAVNSPMTVVDGVVVSGAGFIGTAAQAKSRREPHAREGVTPVPEALDLVRDSGDVAFKGITGFIRKRRVGTGIAKALAHSREADIATESSAAVVHGRKPVEGLEAGTRQQERDVRKAVDTVEDQQFGNAMARRNLYILRATARQNGIKDAGKMTADELHAALGHPGRRLTGSGRKAARVTGRRLEAAQEHAQHAAHQLHEVAAGDTLEARIQAAQRDKALGRARTALDKQAAKEAKKAGKATKTRSLGGSEGQSLR